MGFAIKLAKKCEYFTQMDLNVRKSTINAVVKD
jgi:hypothetical protein